MEAVWALARCLPKGAPQSTNWIPGQGTTVGSCGVADTLNIVRESAQSRKALATSPLIRVLLGILSSFVRGSESISGSQSTINHLSAIYRFTCISKWRVVPDRRVRIKGAFVHADLFTYQLVTR